MPEVQVSANTPFAVEVLVFEEDTYRVLSAGNHIREIREPLNVLQVEAGEQDSHAAGDLVVRGSRWFAILHDFDKPESYCPESVQQVLEHLCAEVGRAGIRSIGIQALGSFHGPERLETAIQWISDCPWPDCLERIWIVIRPGQTRG
jgi:hypothetical protein